MCMTREKTAGQLNRLACRLRDLKAFLRATRDAADLACDKGEQWAFPTMGNVKAARRSLKEANVILEQLREAYDADNILKPQPTPAA